MEVLQEVSKMEMLFYQWFLAFTLVGFVVVGVLYFNVFPVNVWAGLELCGYAYIMYLDWYNNVHGLPFNANHRQTVARLAVVCGVWWYVGYCLWVSVRCRYGGKRSR